MPLWQALGVVAAGHVWPASSGGRIGTAWEVVSRDDDPTPFLAQAAVEQALGTPCGEVLRWFGGDEHVWRIGVPDLQMLQGYFCDDDMTEPTVGSDPERWLFVAGVLLSDAVLGTEGSATTATSRGKRVLASSAPSTIDLPNLLDSAVAAGGAWPAASPRSRQLMFWQALRKMKSLSLPSEIGEALRLGSVLAQQYQGPTVGCTCVARMPRFRGRG
jgi:hypothetical protein